MIIDRLDNLNKYAFLGKSFTAACQLLEEVPFNELEPGKYSTSNDDVYYLIQEYQTQPLDKGVIEAHEQFADVHILLQGEELLGYNDMSLLRQVKRIAENDFLFMEGTVDLLHFRKGFFIILFPNDGHMPGVQIDRPNNVKKVVLKFRC